MREIIASTSALLSVLAAAPARRAQAAEADPPSVSLAIDGAILAGAAAVVGLATLVRPEPAARREHELVPYDEPAKRSFSASAAHASDALVALTVLTPLAVQAGQGFHGRTAARALVYGETLALNLAVNTVTKVVVGRPRPYVYNEDPQVAAYAARARGDAFRSFYSGHAATAFAAAASGGYLFAQSTADTGARTAVWASGLFLAGATANLRVRGGKHFPSDVAVGALVGAGIGVAVPLLHTPAGARPALAPAEWVAIAAAPALGALASQLVPMRADVLTPLGAARIVPWASAGAGGAVLAGRF